MGSTPRAWAIYAEQLVGKGHGLPLWEPEPRRPGAREVQIGDVGYFSEGGFIRLFNAMRPEEHELNKGGVPSTFIMLKGDDDPEFLFHHFSSLDDYIPTGSITAQLVSRQDISATVSDPAQFLQVTLAFECSEERGAVVILGSPGHQQKYGSNARFSKYMLDHRSSWYTFAQEKGHLCPPDLIVLVSGWVKATHWAVASIYNTSKGASLSLSPSATYVTATVQGKMSTRTTASADQRRGPLKLIKDLQPDVDRASETPLSAGDCALDYDQCMFVRYYKLKRRSILGTERAWDEQDHSDMTGPGDKRFPDHPSSPKSRGSGWWSAILSRFWHQASNNGSDGTQGSQCDAGVGEEPSSAAQTLFLDPLDVMLDLLLEHHPEAKAAIICHDDFYSLFPPDKYPKGVERSHMRARLEQGLRTYINADGVLSVRDPHSGMSAIAGTGSINQPYPESVGDINDKTAAAMKPGSYFSDSLEERIRSVQNLRDMVVEDLSNSENIRAATNEVLPGIAIRTAPDSPSCHDLHVMVADKALQVLTDYSKYLFEENNIKNQPFEKIRKTLLENPALQPSDEGVEVRIESLTFDRGPTGFADQHSTEDRLAQKIDSWLRGLVRSTNVQSVTTINAENLVRILSGNNVTNITPGWLPGWTKETYSEKLLDVGILRFPDQKNLHLLLYHIQLVVTIKRDRFLLCVAKEAGEIKGVYSSLDLGLHHRVEDVVSGQVIQQANIDAGWPLLVAQWTTHLPSSASIRRPIASGLGLRLAHSLKWRTARLSAL